MKYILDSMLVRGINRFVPHAFSTKFPDHEYPPHFSDEGNNPSYEGFACLMTYANRAAHLLEGAVHVANAAILYSAEGEWASRYMEAKTMQPIASRLYDAHIDYDIIPMDILETGTVRDGRMYIADESFDCLIVPCADHLPAELQTLLRGLHDSGLPVWFFEKLPENAMFEGSVIRPDALVPEMRSLGMTDVQVEGDCPKLRIYHCRRGDSDIYMFSNEDFSKTADTVVHVPSRGEYARVDLLGESFCGGATVDGELRIRLVPGQSQIVIFGSREGLEEEVMLPEGAEIVPAFRLALAPYTAKTAFTEVGSYQRFFNVTGADYQPGFSGKMKYTFRITVPESAKRVFLDLGRVGQNASLKIGGRDMGIRVAPPYLFEITDAVTAGENEAEVIVSNTLTQQIKDNLSCLLPLAPSGLLGGMKLICN